MKHVLFVLVFMLTGTFVFANNTEVETLNGNVAIEMSSSETTLESEEYGCFDFTLSCGLSGTACGKNTADLVDLILFVDDLIC